VVLISKIRALFLDIGGVLLTDGWPRTARKMSAAKFKYFFASPEELHKLMFATYQLGRATLAQYLDYVIFYQKRLFTRRQIWKFMIDQSVTFPPSHYMMHFKMISMKVAHQEHNGVRECFLCHQTTS
jgi:hypothetical protein